MGSHGIKDRVAIVGMGCTRFAEHWDKSLDDLIIEASQDTFASAGTKPSSVTSIAIRVEPSSTRFGAPAQPATIAAIITIAPSPSPCLCFITIASSWLVVACGHGFRFMPPRASRAVAPAGAARSASRCRPPG